MEWWWWCCGGSDNYYYSNHTLQIDSHSPFFLPQNHDEKGMKWPFEVAPFKAVVVTVGKDEVVHEGAQKMARSLMKIPELGDSVVCR